jgi:hypothetical protein
MMRAIAIPLLALFAACGPDPIDGLPDGPIPPEGVILLAPQDLEVTIVDGAIITQDYTATLVKPDGDQADVTDEAVFSLLNTQYGLWNDSQLSITGQGSGPTRVQAMARGADGDTGLTVFVEQTIVDPGVDPGVPDQFDNATNDPSLAPTVVYPPNNILVPPNLGQFDVHWAAAGGANVFEVRMKNQYVDIKRYTIGDDPGQPFWTVLQPSQWYPIASSRQQLTLSLSGLNTNDPTRRGSAAEQKIDVTNEGAQGGIYYWTTSFPQGIFRYDIATPEVPPAPYFPAGSEPGGQGNCMGCHALSRDGKRIALTIDSGEGRGTVMNVADRAVLVPFDTNSQRWNFATFNADGNKLATVFQGAMVLRSAEGGAVLSSIPNSPGTTATHPEFSPDGTKLVNVEGVSRIYDFEVYDGSIVTRSFDDTTNTFGATQTLVTAGTDGLQNYYPSYSPDGQWIVFTRTGGTSYNSVDAETWVVKADGSAPPIKLQIAGLPNGSLTNSWARWVPYGQTFGEANEPMFYLTFSTTRPFGVRIPGGGLPQIWMTPFFPAKAEAGQDPSGQAFRVPFQNVGTSNHIAQWTQAIVVLQ